MLACGLFFVASLPGAVRQALDISEPVEGVVAARLFAWLAVAPLAAYGLAAALHLVARPFGGRAGFRGARTALFWWALLLAPLTLAVAVLGAAVEVLAPRLLPLASWLGYAVLAFALWLLASTLAEAEGFASTGRVVAMVATAYLLVVTVLAIGNFGA
jgi:hypothetical protein